MTSQVHSSSKRWNQDSHSSNRLTSVEERSLEPFWTYWWIPPSPPELILLLFVNCMIRKKAHENICHINEIFGCLGLIPFLLFLGALNKTLMATEDMVAIDFHREF